MSEDKPKIEPRFDIIDKTLTLVISTYMLAYFLPYIAAISTDDLALIAILAENKPGEAFETVLFLLVGALTGKQIPRITK